MPEPIRELVPGVVHWQAKHPNLGIDVSSYLLTESRVAIDPIMPPDGIDWFEDHDLRPSAIVLTNRHHLRNSKELAARYGAPILASRPGMHEFAPEDGVQPFDFGDELEGGIIAHEVGGICPDETALEIPGVKALAVADGVIDYDTLRFVPDQYMDDPPETKRRLVEAYDRLSRDVDFEHLLVAHGDPVVLNGRGELRDFVRRNSET